MIPTDRKISEWTDAELAEYYARVEYLLENDETFRKQFEEATDRILNTK